MRIILLHLFCMKIIKNNYKLLLLGLLLFISLFVGLFRLADYPNSLHRDEVSIGYNAYSIITNGYDEHGVKLPISFESFGDYKLPGLIYSTALSYKIFGYNDFATRFPTALLSSIIPILFALLILQITKRFDWAVVSGFVVIFTPWHLMASHGTYEPTVGQFWILLALNFVFLSRKYLWAFIPALLVFITSWYFYYVDLLITLPILCIYFIVYAKDYFSNKKKLLAIVVFIFGIVFVIISTVFILKGNNKAKLDVTILGNKDQVTELNFNIHKIASSGFPIRFARLFVNKPMDIAQSFIYQYSKVWNMDFLFGDGDRNPWRDMDVIGIGNFTFLAVFFMLIGIYRLLKFKDKYAISFLFLWLIIAPFPNAFTIDSPVTNRLQDFLLLISLFVGIGIVYWWRLISNLHIKIKWDFNQKYLHWILQFITVIVIIYSVVWTLLGFYIMFPKSMPIQWNLGLKEVVQTVKSLEDDYDRIIVNDGRIGLGYIEFAYHRPFDPVVFQQTAGWTQTGFHRVVVFDKYLFDPIPDFKDPLKVQQFFPKGTNKILIVDRIQHFSEVKDAIQVFYDWHHIARWKLYEVTREGLLSKHKNNPSDQSKRIVKWLENYENVE